MNNSNHTLNILYEDNHLLVIVKPAGILTQADNTEDVSLLDMAKSYIKDKYNKPGDVYLGLVHRLDRPVSGVICFARTSKAASRLSEQFRSRKTTKIYHAIVEGHSADNHKKLTNFLEFEKGRVIKSKVVGAGASGAKKAELEYKILKRGASRELLEVRLLTGYKHQIRAQLANNNLPIVGDYKYSHNFKGTVEKLFQGRAVALHAHTLSLLHPTKKEEMSFTAPYPDYWPKV